MLPLNETLKMDTIIAFWVPTGRHHECITMRLIAMLLAMSFIVAIDGKLIFTLLMGRSNCAFFWPSNLVRNTGFANRSEFLHAVMRDWAQTASLNG